MCLRAVEGIPDLQFFLMVFRGFHVIILYVLKNGLDTTIAILHFVQCTKVHNL